MPPPVIRPARQSDWIALWPLVQDAQNAQNAQGIPVAAASPEAFRARYQTIIQSAEHRLLVAENSAALLGYAWAQQLGPDLRSGLLLAVFHDLYLSPEARRQGLGRQLFEALCAWARQAGVGRLSWQAHPAAEAFYQRLGLHPEACAYVLPLHTLPPFSLTRPQKESAL